MRRESYAELLIYHPHVSSVLEVVWHGLRTLMFCLVQPVDDDVALADTKRIEVLPHSHCKLVFVYPSFRFCAYHSRRHASYTLTEDDVAERVLEGRGCVEVVGSSVALEDGRLLGSPFHLMGRQLSVFGAHCSRVV